MSELTTTESDAARVVSALREVADDMADRWPLAAAYVQGRATRIENRTQETQ